MDQTLIVPVVIGVAFSALNDPKFSSREPFKLLRSALAVIEWMVRWLTYGSIGSSGSNGSRRGTIVAMVRR